MTTMNSDFGVMANLQKYAQSGNRPNQHTYTKYYVYTRGSTLFEGFRDAFETWKAGVGRTYFTSGQGPAIEKFVDAEAFNEARVRWVESEHLRLASFKRDLFAYYGVTDHHNVEKAYDLAMSLTADQGTSTAQELDELAECFEKLVTLLK